MSVAGTNHVRRSLHPTYTPTVTTDEEIRQFVADRDEKYPRYLFDYTQSDLTVEDFREFVKFYEGRHPNWKVVFGLDEWFGQVIAMRRDLL